MHSLFRRYASVPLASNGRSTHFDQHFLARALWMEFDHRNLPLKDLTWGFP